MNSKFFSLSDRDVTVHVTYDIERDSYLSSHLMPKSFVQRMDFRHFFYVVHEKLVQNDIPTSRRFAIQIYKSQKYDQQNVKC